MADKILAQQVGRRKRAIARVILRKGTGNITVNGCAMDDYFSRGNLSLLVKKPLALSKTDGEFDIFSTISGGGLSGQAGALQLGITRSVVSHDEGHRAVLRKNGLLTRDARQVERKKIGLRKARKRPQYSKR